MGSWGEEASSGFTLGFPQGNDLLECGYQHPDLSPNSSCRKPRWISLPSAHPLIWDWHFPGKVFEVREPLEEC